MPVDLDSDGLETVVPVAQTPVSEQQNSGRSKSSCLQAAVLLICMAAFVVLLLSTSRFKTEDTENVGDCDVVFYKTDDNVQKTEEDSILPRENRFGQNPPTDETNLQQDPTHQNSTPIQIEAESNEVCSICLEELGTTDLARLNDCHTFHEKCISKWLAEKQNCPNCRNLIVNVNNEPINEPVYEPVELWEQEPNQMQQQNPLFPKVFLSTFAFFTFAVAFAAGDLLWMSFPIAVVLYYKVFVALSNYNSFHRLLNRSRRLQRPN